MTKGSAAGLFPAAGGQDADRPPVAAGPGGGDGRPQASLLGALRLTAVGRQLDLGPPRQRTVLAVLLVEAGQAVPMGVLIDRVWDGAPPPGARSGLYSYLTRLRRVLHQAGGGGAQPPRLRRRHGGYLLDIDPQQVDLHRFRRLVAQAHRADVADPRRAVLLDEAIALWGGAALAGVPGSWADRTREVIGHQYLDAVLLWMQVQLRRGCSGAVLAPARQLLAEHPLVEPLAAGLIDALRQQGRFTEALDQYHTIRRRLAEEAGIEPGPQLRRLYQQLLRGDSSAPDG
jgi:DNA-binding SARP family transcriptional activator